VRDPEKNERKTVRIPTLAPDGSSGECGVTFHPKRWYEMTFFGPPLGEIVVIERTSLPAWQSSPGVCQRCYAGGFSGRGALAEGRGGTGASKHQRNF
jgi:hypothetical protein